MINLQFPESSLSANLVVPGNTTGRVDIELELLNQAANSLQF